MLKKYEKIELGKAKDLTNIKFGRLLPLYRTTNIGKKTAWVCQCDCGNLAVITADKITSKSTQSCGCLQKERASQSNLKDLTGKIFGRLTVIKLVERDPQLLDRHSQWLCKCSCGSETIVASNRLTSGHTKSCGCFQKEQSSNFHTKDLINNKYGLLTPLKIVREDENGNKYWECLCDCGNVAQIRANHLISGEIKSCGCLKKSYGENLIANLLTQNNHSFIVEKTFDNCKNPKTNRHLRFDFYVDNTYLIEFDGIQHFKERLDSKFETLDTIQERDQIKNKWCIDNNITLIRIPYIHLSKLTIEDIEIKTSKFIYQKGD